MTPDITNALFELIGGYFTWINAWILFKDKEIKGVYLPAWVFFTSWGVWNLFYYPAIGQMWSFYAGIFLVSGNVVWVSLAFKYVVWPKWREIIYE